MGIEKDLTELRNRIVTQQRQLIVNILIIAITILFAGLSSINLELVKSLNLFLLAMLLLILNASGSLWYLNVRIKKDLSYIDDMIEACRKGKFAKEFERIEKKHSWKDSWVLPVLSIIFIAALISAFLSLRMIQAAILQILYQLKTSQYR